MDIKEKDRDILRKLAEEKTKIASFSIHKQTISEWKRINEIKKGKPVIYITEIPWNEMNVNDELTVSCEDNFLQYIEFWELRTQIYQWKRMPADMVIENIVYCPIVIKNTGFGIKPVYDDIIDNEKEEIAQRHFHQQIKKEKDIEKIKMPEISVEWEETEKRFQMLNEIFGDIIKVEKRGISAQSFSPWDILITWYGVQEALMDLALNPEILHLIVDKITSGFLYQLEQYEKLGVLSLNNGNICVGSGGPGYTDLLPQKDFNPNHIRPIDQWASAASPIFSEVSPRMHEEFALQYEKKWLEKFGLTYYGYREPLHNKIEILKNIKNLKKISVSPRADIEKSIEKIGTDYVFSYKPNSAILAKDQWDIESIKKDLSATIEKITKSGCICEIIMEDINTVHHQPQRLWEWAKIVKEIVGQD
jgi:hypothetical protein